MGWTGVPYEGRANTAELNQIIDEAMHSDSYDIIDRSGWMGWNHQYLLCELKENALPDETCRRFITLAMVERTTHEIRYRLVDEAEGPVETDCPKRILDTADEYAPTDDRSRDWRARCRQHRADITEFNRALKRVERREEGADPRILMHGGRIVTYAPAHSRGQNIRAYRNEGDPQLWRLNMKAVDVAGTVALHRERQASMARAA